MAASPSGSRSPLRTGGIALLGVGVIAATIGLFTSVTGGNDAGTAVPSASSQALPATAPPVSAQPEPPVAPEPTAPAVAPTEVAPAPAATAPAVPEAAAPAPAPAAPAPAPGAGGPDGSGSAAGGSAGAGSAGTLARAPLRVYNNSLVQGLAAKAKSDFEAAGWTVTAISGYGEGVVPQSTVYFRPGTSEEAAAQELGREFGLRVEPRFPGIAQSTDGVIVIVTGDYKPQAKS